MPLKTVCRICLSTDAPVRYIADSPLQDVYEKLTNKSLDIALQPLVACYICYSQLWKCHKLLVRSVRANKLLARLQQNGEVVSMESIAKEKHDMRQMNELRITPVELIVISGSGDQLVNANIEERPQDKQKIYKDRRCIDYLMFEELDGGPDGDTDGVEMRGMENIENYVFLDGAEINDQIKMAVDIEIDRLTGSEDIMEEKPEGTKTYCLGSLKYEDTDNEEDNKRNELTVEKNTRHKRPLSHRPNKVTENHLEDSEHGEEIEGAFLIDVEGTKKYVFTDEEEFADEEIKTEDTESMDADEEVDVISIGSTMQQVLTPSHHVRTDSLPRTSIQDWQIFQRSNVCRMTLRAFPKKRVMSPSFDLTTTQRRRKHPMRRVRSCNTDSKTECPEDNYYCSRSVRSDREKHRRNSLRNLFAELKEQIPATRHKEQTPKVLILREAISLCRKLRQEDIQRDRLKKKQNMLMAKLRRLRAGSTKFWQS